MDEKQFLGEIETVCQLATEVSKYARIAWHTLAHRDRIFAIYQPAKYTDPQKEKQEVADVSGWMWLWTTTVQDSMYVGFTKEYPRAYLPYGALGRHLRLVTLPEESECKRCEPVTDLTAYSAFMRVTRPAYQTLLNVFSTDLTRGITYLKQGLAQLFDHINQECTTIASTFASAEAELRWGVYRSEFVERFNTRNLVTALTKALRELQDQSVALQKEPVLGKTKLTERIGRPIDTTLQLVERAQQATKEGKLFVE